MQPSREVRILVADDHDLVRRGVKALLSSKPSWVVCAEAATGREAIIQAAKHRPDIGVVDISMPELNGIDTMRKLCKMLPKICIAVFSMHYSDQLLRDAVEAGARAYVLKSDADKDLLLAVEALVNGRAFFTSGAAKTLINDFVSKDERSVDVKHKQLTLREREITQLIAEGRSSNEVAKVLGISPYTADSHRWNLMHKLDLHSVVELVRYAVRNSIIEP